MNRKPVIYIASPCTQGDLILNVRFQYTMFDELMNDKIITPIMPL